MILNFSIIKILLGLLFFTAVVEAFGKSFPLDLDVRLVVEKRIFKEAELVTKWDVLEHRAGEFGRLIRIARDKCGLTNADSMTRHNSLAEKGLFYWERTSRDLNMRLPHIDGLKNEIELGMGELLALSEERIMSAFMNSRNARNAMSILETMDMDGIGAADLRSYTDAPESANGKVLDFLTETRARLEELEDEIGAENINLLSYANPELEKLLQKALDTFQDELQKP